MSGILLIGDRAKPQVRAAVEEARRFFSAAGVRTRKVALGTDPIRAGPARLAVVFGGDGAILSAVRALGTQRVPVIGVNFGRLGFLTEFDIKGFRQNLDRLAKGRFRVEKRMRLSVWHLRGRVTRWNGLAVNEGIVTSRDIARITRLTCLVDGAPVAAVAGDGLIAATPIGSTAHSLSAGGPIVEQGAEAILITPICAHTLNSRPLVLSGSHTVEFVVEPGSAAPVLTVDGQLRGKLVPGDRVRFARSRHPLWAATLGARDYFKALADAFQWGRM